MGAPAAAADAAPAAARSRRHDTFPRWFRLAFRLVRQRRGSSVAPAPPAGRTARRAAAARAHAPAARDPAAARACAAPR
jgi:hypothetical protein